MKIMSVRNVFNNLLKTVTLDKLNDALHLYNSKSNGIKFRTPPKSSVNIYIDGLLYIYLCSSKIKDKFSSNVDENNKMLANYCVAKLRLLIREWEHYININNTKILIDGVSPVNKIRKIKTNKIKPFSISGVKKYLKSIKFKNFEVVETFGEADVDLVFNRDTKYTSILISNDSDVLTIASKYSPKSNDDKIVVYAWDIDQFYLLDRIECSLSKDALKLCLILLGTDYIPSFITLRSFYYLMTRNIDVEIRCKDDLIVALIKIYNILLKSHIKHPVVSYIDEPESECKNNFINIQNLMYWNFVYFSTGIDKCSSKYEIQSFSVKKFFEYCASINKTEKYINIGWRNYSKELDFTCQKPIDIE